MLLPGDRTDVSLIVWPKIAFFASLRGAKIGQTGVESVTIMVGRRAFQGNMTISNQCMRAAFGAFATGVTVVTARADDGRPVAMTVSSFAGVSLDPPLILWCAQRDVWPFAVFNTTGHFAVHVLHAGQADLAMHFAREIDDKFADIEHRTGLEGVPILDDYAALFQCRVEQRLDGGDHAILLGRVMELDHKPNDALVFHAGQLGGFDPSSGS